MYIPNKYEVLVQTHLTNWHLYLEDTKTKQSDIFLNMAFIQSVKFNSNDAKMGELKD